MFYHDAETKFWDYTAAVAQCLSCLKAKATTAGAEVPCWTCLECIRFDGLYFVFRRDRNWKAARNYVSVLNVRGLRGWTAVKVDTGAPAVFVAFISAWTAVVPSMMQRRVPRLPQWRQRKQEIGLTSWTRRDYTASCFDLPLPVHCCYLLKSMNQWVVLIYFSLWPRRVFLNNVRTRAVWASLFLKMWYSIIILISDLRKVQLFPMSEKGRESALYQPVHFYM